MPARLSPTERIRAQIDELFAGGQPLAETLEEAARLSVRLVIQAALEAEVAEFLGRGRYQRDPDAGPGYRNGHQPVQVKTTAGPVVLERPKLRGTGEPFVSRLLGSSREPSTSSPASSPMTMMRFIGTPVASQVRWKSEADVGS